jgi:hypothetical protein
LLSGTDKGLVGFSVDMVKSVFVALVAFHLYSIRTKNSTGGSF